MRARYPDCGGFVERDGVKVAYDQTGPEALAHAIAAEIGGAALLAELI
jgi:hypothetical protein